MARVLIVDDDETIRELLSDMVERMGHQAFTAGTLAEGYRKASAQDADLVFLDIRLPDGNGLDLLVKLRELPSQPEVIIITGLGDADGAELAIKNGAWDYIKKSSSIKEVALPFIRALQYQEEKRMRKPFAVLKTNNIVGSSKKTKACLEALAQIANSEASVLITGETGTGKELFARAIHDNSIRAGKNFVVVDCTTLPETLVESVLFGYEKGAYTGADKSQEGLVSQANGGTLFLDEIGELPLSIQRTFLRVLQEHRFRPLGGKREIDSDFRLVAATNRNIDAMVQAGQFRTDLSFRIRTLTLELSPLRNHLEDTKELAIYYMSKFCEKYKLAPKGFSPEFFDVLTSYNWPGNVRELVNAIEQVIAGAKHEPTLFPRNLPTEIRVKVARASLTKGMPVKSDLFVDSKGGPMPIDEYRDAMEHKYLQDLLVHTGAKIRDACKISGLSRSRLYALLKKYNLTGKASP
jgi:two-component system NtrC family response regulator